jgi:hypothetical protein
VRFPDFLKATVLISAGAATALAAVTAAGAAQKSSPVIVFVAAVWWSVAAAYGAFIGRGRDPNPQIAKLLAGARTAQALPELAPGTVLLNRLWPLLLCTIGAGAIAFLVPQVAAVAAGFAILWSLSWRHQEAAVAAIEDRDGVRFYVERTSPIQPIRLLRTTGLKQLPT